MAKFNTMEQYEGRHGLTYVTEGVIVGKKKVPCSNCKELTEFIEICSEAHFCSEECEKEWYRKYDEWVKSIPNEEL